MAKPAAPAMAYVLVKASGENSLPSCACRLKTGRNETVMMRSEKNSEGPTSVAASIRTSARGRAPALRSKCLWAFSTITTAASTMAPIAIASPPSDMMFALSPWWYMTMNETRMPSGSVRIATKALRTWNRKSTHTRATMPISSSSFRCSVATARSMSPARS